MINTMSILCTNDILLTIKHMIILIIKYAFLQFKLCLQQRYQMRYDVLF